MAASGGIFLRPLGSAVISSLVSLNKRDCLISTSKYPAPFALPCTAMWQLIAQLRPPAVVFPPRSAYETVAYLWASSYAAVPKRETRKWVQGILMLRFLPIHAQSCWHSLSTSPPVSPEVFRGCQTLSVGSNVDLWQCAVDRIFKHASSLRLLPVQRPTLTSSAEHLAEARDVLGLGARDIQCTVEEPLVLPTGIDDS
eukprot:1594362-Rhodomonas_salina.1